MEEKRKVNKYVTTLTVELYQRGAVIKCEDLDQEYKVDSGNDFMDVLNEITELCDPDATWQLTEEGKQYLKFLEEQEKKKKKRNEKNGNETNTPTD